MGGQRFLAVIILLGREEQCFLGVLALHQGDTTTPVVRLLHGLQAQWGPTLGPAWCRWQAWQHQAGYELTAGWLCPVLLSVPVGKSGLRGIKSYLAQETLISHLAVHRPVKCLAELGSGHLMRGLSPVLPPTACTHPVVVGLILTRASNRYLVTGYGTC